MALAEQIEALCKDHDLTSLSFGFSYGSGTSYHWSAYAHGGGLCESGLGPNPMTAIREAINLLNMRRNKGADVPVLEEA